MSLNEFRLWNKIKPFATPEDSSLKEEGPDEAIGRISNVTDPSIRFFPAASDGDHPAVLICPGGAYEFLSSDLEGTEIAQALNFAGFSAFVLKYRCPNRCQAAAADAARAMRLIRADAEKFHILPNKLGIMGFSAGAHLSAYISAPGNPEFYPADDEVDQLSCRPNFTALIYPAYLMNDQLQAAPEFRITPDVPPTFLVQTEDDGIRVENALGWFWALKKAGVPAEMHLYEKGGHGYGLRSHDQPVSVWWTPALEWFRRQASK